MFKFLRVAVEFYPEKYLLFIVTLNGQLLIYGQN